MITLPWNNHTAPNVMLEILDQCNIRCNVCYKRHSDKIKSMDEIKHDLEVASRLRNLQMVSISGGEPTLHPNLLEIISLIKSKGYIAGLLTNGTLLNDDFLYKLKSAGLDAILFHIDTGQTRPDLPRNRDLQDIKKRLYALADKAIELGLDVSFSWTILNYSEKEIDFILKMFLGKPDVTFLFLSKGLDPKTLSPKLRKSSGINKNTRYRLTEKVTESMQWIKDYFENKYAISPFAYIPAITSDNKYLKNPIFISYFLPAIYHNNSLHYIYHFVSNNVDKALMYIPRLFKKRFIHKTPRNSKITGLRVLLNSVSRIRFDLLIKFFVLSAAKSKYIRNKMIVYDDGPLVLEDGTVAVCEFCPTAILKNDKLVRCCEIYFEDQNENNIKETT